MTKNDFKHLFDSLLFLTWENLYLNPVCIVRVCVYDVVIMVYIHEP